MDSTIFKANAKTVNGALTHSTTKNSVLDLFFVAGASRNISNELLERLFVNAFNQNPDLTTKLFFWSRDIRQGAGERKFFRNALVWLCDNSPSTFLKNLPLIPEFGRWDDMFHLIENVKDDEITIAIIDLIKKGLENKDGLLAKWLPRKGDIANTIRKNLKLTPKQYRKLIVELSNTVEQQMCTNSWSAIEYSHLPSGAMNKYRKAFNKRDKERFNAFILKALNGEIKINANAIYPYQLYQAYKKSKGDNLDAIIAQWNALPDYMQNSKEFIIPVCDVSGSMKNYGGLPMDMSISLGLYISERNKGIFKDIIMTFSQTPTIEKLTGNVIERMQQLQHAHWGTSTNLEATFDLLLEKAIKNNVSPSGMPTILLIISDMEFNSATRCKTNYEVIQEKYLNAGYQVPKIVFWNVNGREGNNPVQQDQYKVGLVSGGSPSIVKSILNGKDFTPISIMLETLESPRYEKITS